MVKEQIKVSVIVPVYNVERYLQRCLDSILKQTEKNIEIICIEDCSTDTSFELLKQIGQNDKRIQIIRNKRNCGLAFSRNCGITIADGEFIMFVDSDDYVPDCAVENMYRIAAERELDLVYGDVEIIPEEGILNAKEQVRIRKGDYKDTDGMQMFAQLVKHREMFGAAWGVLYRTSFIKREALQFRKDVLHEDIFFTFKAVLMSKRVGCIHQICYYYVQRADSIMSSGNLEQKLKGLIIAYFDMLTFWNERESMLDGISESISKFINIYYRYIQNVYRQMDFSRMESSMLMYLEDTGLFKNIEHSIKIASRDMEIIEKSETVLVYGAGSMAIKVLDYLNRYNIHVDAFIVTDIRKNSPQIRNVPVYGKKFIESINGTAAIILGVSEKFKEEIRSQLHIKEEHRIIEYIA